MTQNTLWEGCFLPIDYTKLWMKGRKTRNVSTKSSIHKVDGGAVWPSFKSLIM